MAQSYASKVEQGMEYAQQRAKSLGADAEQLANTAAEQGSKAMTAAKKGIEEASSVTAQFVKEKPLLALGAAALAAFAVGALWKAGNQR